jgi:HEAT repeat protein
MENIDVFVEAAMDPIPEVREAAGSILSRMDPAVVSDKILDALCSGSGESTARLDDVLGLMKDVLEPGMLRVLQADDAPSLRKQAAAYTLGRINSTVAIPVLIARVNQPDSDLAITCANALMALNDPMLIPTLLDLTQHPIQQIRWAAVQCVADLGGPDSMEALGRVAITPPEGDAELGRRAVALLGNTRSNAATPILIEVMRRNLSLRRMAVEALHKITGQDLGDRPSEWQAWYEASLQQPSPEQMQDDEDSPYAVEIMP